jgi:hypothetical protein
MMTASEDSSPKLQHHLSKTASTYDLTISTAKTKILALTRAKIMVNINTKSRL